MKMIITDTIGGTPVVRINKIFSHSDVAIYAKLEGFNPAGSVKDRIARRMVEDAEAAGRLHHGVTIIEPTSGNTGIGLAMIAAVKGYRLDIVMPESMSLERRKILRSMGAELILTPGDEGMTGAIKKAEALARDPKYFLPNQFSNPSNVAAHYDSTGPELLEALGKIDVFVAGIGTGGTLTGVGRRLKEADKATKTVGVEPRPASRIQGLKNLSEGYVPAIIDFSVIDERVLVEDEEAFAMARRLIKEEGLSVGISSGAAMVEAIRQAERLESGVVAVIFPDRADRYVSTELFD
jgi:S-sulfo-L-cysteine synthase (O-acetyl-L-serine-dependent)